MKTSTAAGIGVAAVVLLGASYAGATAYSGQRAEAEVLRQVAKVQVQYPFLKVTDAVYDRGLFRSTSTMNLQLGCVGADGKAPFSATVTNVIHHGPLAGGAVAAAVIDSEFRLGGATGAAPLTAHTVVGFKGSYRGTLRSLPMQVAGPNGGSVAWQGMTGELDGNTALNRINYHLASPGLTVTDAGATSSLHVGALDVQADTQAVAATSMLRVGKLHGSIDKVELVAAFPTGADDAAAKPTRVSLEKLQFADDISLTGDLIGGTASFSGAGAVGDTKVDRVEMQMSMKRLHAPTYQRLMDTFAKASYGCASVKADAAAAMFAPMQADLQAMLQFNPELSVDKLAIDYGGKRGEFAYTVGVRGVTSADAAQPPMPLMMAHAYATASARLPLLWLQQFAAAVSSKMATGTVPEPEMLATLLDQFVEQGYVVRDGEYVKSSASLDAGAITVNGKPMGGAPR